MLDSFDAYLFLSLPRAGSIGLTIGYIVLSQDTAWGSPEIPSLAFKVISYFLFGISQY